MVSVHMQEWDCDKQFQFDWAVKASKAEMLLNRMKRDASVYSLLSCFPFALLFGSPNSPALAAESVHYHAIGSTAGQIAINRLDAMCYTSSNCSSGERLTVFKSTRDVKLQPLQVHRWSWKVNGVAFTSVTAQSSLYNSIFCAFGL